MNGEGEGNFSIRHSGCVISLHPYNSPLAEAVLAHFPWALIVLLHTHRVLLQGPATLCLSTSLG